MVSPARRRNRREGGGCLSLLSTTTIKWILAIFVMSMGMNMTMNTNKGLWSSSSSVSTTTASESTTMTAHESEIDGSDGHDGSRSNSSSEALHNVIDQLTKEVEALRGQIKRINREVEAGMEVANNSHNNNGGTAATMSIAAEKDDGSSNRADDSGSMIDIHTSSSSFVSWNTSSMADALMRMSASEEREVLNIVHGQEYPEEHQLTCPRMRPLHEITAGSGKNVTVDVIVGYHVGMLHNWRSIVRDQLHTLDQCGIGDIMSHMYVTYSNNATDSDVDDLTNMISRYDFGRGRGRGQHQEGGQGEGMTKTTINIAFSRGQPVEGTAINAIHSHCMTQGDNKGSEPGETETETVAFYFHTKGSSRWTPDWKAEAAVRKKTYKEVLAWRKYMEYFLIERPEVCIKHLVTGGGNACGVFFFPRKFIYGGNFWSAKCSYLRTLTPMKIVSEAEANKKTRFIAERWITFDHHPELNSDRTGTLRKTFISLHGFPTTNPYIYHFAPHLYSDYTHRWMEDGK